MMELSNVDLVFVISLGLLVISMIVFLIFFIPVLQQLLRVLKATEILLDNINEYTEEIKSKINAAGSGVAKVLNHVTSFMANVKDTVSDLLFSK